MYVVTFADGSIVTLHRGANINVVSYGTTLRTSSNSVRGTVSFLHRGNLTGRTGGTSHITTRNVTFTAISATGGINIIIRIGTRASFTTGDSGFISFIGAITRIVVSRGPTSISTLVTTGIGNRAVTSLLHSGILIVNRGLDIHHFIHCRNSYITCIRNNNHVNILIGFRTSTTTSNDRTLVRYNGSITVRVTTLGTPCLGRTAIPTRIVRHRGTIRLRVVGGSPGGTGGPRGVLRGVVANGVHGCFRRGYLLGRTFIGSNGVGITRCVRRRTGMTNNRVTLISFIHFRGNRNVRGHISSFTDRITSVIGWDMCDGSVCDNIIDEPRHYFCLLGGFSRGSRNCIFAPAIFSDVVGKVGLTWREVVSRTAWMWTRSPRTRQ